MSVEPRPTACSRRGGAQGIGRAGSKEPDMALLEVRGANVRFGGHKAVRDVDLDVAAGPVTGLIGPNGAGTTTRFIVLTGLPELVRVAVRLDCSSAHRQEGNECSNTCTAQVSPDPE